MKYSLFTFVLLLAGAIFPSAALAATGDITAIRIEPNGWEAEIDIEGFKSGGAYNFGLGSSSAPVNPTITLQTTSQGFDAAGNPTTVSRTVLGTQWIRLPYPANTGTGPGTVKDEVVNGNTLTIKVALSDFIYAGDTNITAHIASGAYTDSGSGGTQLANAVAPAVSVTSSSTLPYPKVIGRWAWPGYERETGDFPVEAAIFDRFPEQGSPVAAVVFTATDQHGNSVQVTSNSVTRSVHTGDANVVQTYGATIPVAPLTQGDVVTVNFKAYPWVGDASSTLDSSIGADGVAQPSEKLGPLTEVNDAQGTYGVGYALVSPNGATTTAKVYSSEADAEAGGAATAFTTIGKAAEAIKAFQLANYGRANAGGGVILLAAGSYTYPGYSPTTDLGPSDTWLIVRPAAGVARTDAIVGGNYRTLNTDKLKFEGLTLSGSGTLAKGRGSSDIIWLHNNAMNLPSGSETLYYRAVYATQNAITAFGQNFTTFSSYTSPFVLIRGNNAPMMFGDQYTILGNKNIRPKFIEAGGTNAPSENSIYAFNTFYGLSTQGAAMILTTNTMHGVAMVENVIEKVTGVQPLWGVAADSSYAIANNIIVWRNTFAGERENLGYNEYGSVPYDRLNWRMGYNIFQQWNNKDDRFNGATNSPPDAHRIGGWPVGYNVGSSGNLLRTTAFPPEFIGLNSTLGKNPQYVRDASYAGTAAGNGDYELTASSPAIDIAGTPGMFDQMLPFDLLGNPMTGIGIDAGAYEYAGSLPPPDITPPVVTVVSPSGTLPAGTATTTLSVTTDENATCHYATTSSVAFTSMTSFTTTGTTSHSVMLTGLSGGQSYQYYVKCQDIAGNVSSDTSVTFSVTASSPPVDINPPTIAITAPANGATVSGTTTITASASDDVGVVSVQFLVDGASVGSARTAAPYAYDWDTSTASIGTHTIAAIASDAAGNSATSSPITVTVSTATSTQSSGADTTSGMVVHLTFDQADTTNSTATDSSGSGHNGTLVGTPTSTAGHFGDALSFNGTNYVDLGTSNFGLTTPYTVSFWVYQTANGNTATYPAMVGRGQYVYPFAYQLYGSSSTNRWRLATRTSTGVTYLSPTTAVLKNQWYLVTVVQDTSGRSFYVNGSLLASDAPSGTISWPANNNLTIGKATPTTTNDGIVGAIDDFRLYNRALAPLDVAALYQGQ